MIISQGMKAAVNQYYAFKNIGGGSFRDNEIKEHCLDTLTKEARKSKINIAVAPGVIYLSKGQQRMTIREPFRI